MRVAKSLQLACLLLLGCKPADFGAQARTMYRVFACAGDAPLPAGADRAAIDAHCQDGSFTALRDAHRAYQEKAQRFFLSQEGVAAATTVVYPFGGGDLMTALTTFANATEITTLSLERAGDVQAIDRLDPQVLSVRLRDFSDPAKLGQALDPSGWLNGGLTAVEGDDFGGLMTYALLALALHGFEPVALRYFRLDEDGDIRYLSARAIANLASNEATPLSGGVNRRAESIAFSNAELTFRPIGGGPLRVYRHIAADLSDQALATNPRSLRHLEMKGDVAAMTKAALFLLWTPELDTLRRYLLDHLTVMISDATGIPPTLAARPGITQEAFGCYDGPSYAVFAGTPADQAMRAMSTRELPFPWGYKVNSCYMVMLTRRSKR
jgi:hypothetical protein